MKPRYKFILFVAGNEVNSRMAQENLSRVCDELGENCRFEVVDVLEDFEAAIKHHILLTPSLLIQEPVPGALIVGNLSDRSRLEQALGIEPRGEVA